MRRALVCALLGVLLTVLLHLFLLDGLPGLVLRLVDRTEDTVFAEGYREGAFRWLRKGTTQEEILSSLGPPLAQVWSYEVEGHTQVSFRIEGGQVSEIFLDRNPAKRTVSVGNTVDQVVAQLGYPSQEAWIYSFSPSDSSHRKRSLILENGSLIQKRHSFYVD